MTPYHGRMGDFKYVFNVQRTTSFRPSKQFQFQLFSNVLFVLRNLIRKRPSPYDDHLLPSFETVHSKVHWSAQHGGRPEI